MNTLLDFVLWGIDRELAEIVSDKIMKRIKDLQKVLDRFDPASETFQVNQSAYSEELNVSPVLFEIIKRSVKDFHRTQGYFNIFAGKAYTALRETGNSTSGVLAANFPEEIIAMNESKSSIRFLHHEVSLDFGGIGKGLALDEVSSVLNEMEIKNAFISFGGSSILTRGHHPHGDYWPFSFQDPNIGQKIWPLTNDALSISCAEQGSEKKAHILNPKTGRSSEKITTGVQSESATEAEVLSTTLVAAPPGKHQEITSHFNVKRWAVFDTIVR